MPLRESKKIEDRLPDREASHGRAWRCRPKPELMGPTICAWIVEAPWAHPLWANYAIAAIHLRDIVGLKAPKMYLENATHEMWVFALDPNHTPDLTAPLSHHLLPVNFSAQWNAASDIDAEAKIESCVEAIIAGELSPDTDFISAWVARFNGAMLKN